MENIHVCDNFLQQDELKKAISIIKENSWKYGHTSLGKETYETPFWHMTLTNDDFFSNNLLKIIEKHFSKKFKLERVYANGQTFGQDGAFHTDTDEPKAFTFCLYLTDIKKNYVEIAGGHIFFKLPEYKYKICYEPVFNRGILFPSNYIHKASCFTRYIMDMRICVAWKLREIDINNCL
jgi:hypothetical protein